MNGVDPADGVASPPTGGQPVQLARNTAVMAAGTLLSRLTGFGRLAAMTAAFGVVEGQLADAYNKANVAPNIVYELVLGGVLSSVLIPVFVETLHRDRDEHRHVVNAVTTIAGVVLVVIAVVAIIAAPALAVLFTLGAGGTAQEVAALRDVVTVFLRLFMPQVLFYGLTTLWTAYLNAHRHFAAPMFAPVLNNLVVIAVVLLFAAAVRFEAVDLAALTAAQLLLLGLGTTGGIVAMTLPLWPVARRRGWSWRPSLDWRHPMVRRVGQLGGWAVLYVIVNQLGYLVVIVLTSAVPGEGAFSAYFYAFVLFQLPHGIYAVSVMTALVPAMAEAASRGDGARFGEHLARGVRATAVLIVPAAAGLAVLSTPIVRLLLEQGVFTAQSTALVAPVLTAFALGLASFSLFQLFLRAHYALQDTRTPALVNVGAVSVNVTANVVLFALLPGQWKVVGLALGHAIAYTVGTAVFTVLLRRRLGGLGGGDMRSQLLRIGVAAVGMAVLAWVTARLVQSVVGVDTLATQAAQVTAAVGVGAGSYLLLARALGVSEVTSVLRMVGERLRR